MFQTLTKRGRDTEVLADDVREPKRFQGERRDRFLDLLQLDQTLSDEEEDDCAPSEELVTGIMRSLEKEIVATGSTSYLPSNSGDSSAAFGISTDQESEALDWNAGVDLFYLLNASDYELGIPPSPALDSKDIEVCLYRKETYEGLLKNPDLRYLGENWHFEDDFESYQQFALYEDAWNEAQVQDYLNTNFICPDILFERDYSEVWTLETASDM